MERERLILEINEHLRRHQPDSVMNETSSGDTTSMVNLFRSAQRNDDQTNHELLLERQQIEAMEREELERDYLIQHAAQQQHTLQLIHQHQHQQQQQHQQQHRQQQYPMLSTALRVNPPAALAYTTIQAAHARANILQAPQRVNTQRLEQMLPARELVEISGKDKSTEMINSNHLMQQSAMKEQEKNRNMIQPNAKPQMKMNEGGGGLEKWKMQMMRDNRPSSSSKKTRTMEGSRDGGSSQENVKKKIKYSIEGPIVQSLLAMQTDADIKKILPKTDEYLDDESAVLIATSKILHFGDPDLASIYDNAQRKDSENQGSKEFRTNSKFTFYLDGIRSVASFMIEDRKKIAKVVAKEAVKVAMGEMKDRHNQITAKMQQSSVESSQNGNYREMEHIFMEKKAKLEERHKAEIKLLQQEQEKFINELQKKHKNQIEKLRRENEQDKSIHAKTLNNYLSASCDALKMLREYERREDDF